MLPLRINEIIFYLYFRNLVDVGHEESNEAL